MTTIQLNQKLYLNMFRNYTLTEIKMKEHLEKQNYDHWVKDKQISEKEVIETVKSTQKKGLTLSPIK